MNLVKISTVNDYSADETFKILRRDFSLKNPLPIEVISTPLLQVPESRVESTPRVPHKCEFDQRFELLRTEEQFELEKIGMPGALTRE